MSSLSARTGAIASIVATLILTVLEFPAPIGFETRPQNHVSLIWLLFFLVIVITEIATLPLIFKRPKLGVKLGLAAAALNIFQVIADQFHLIQPEIASFGYSLLEYSIVLTSALLIYFCLKVRQVKTNSRQL